MDLNGLKNKSTNFFENSLKSMQIFQLLMGGMNVRERSQKNQTSSPVQWGVLTYCMFLLESQKYLRNICFFFHLHGSWPLSSYSDKKMGAWRNSYLKKFGFTYVVIKWKRVLLKFAIFKYVSYFFQNSGYLNKMKQKS